MHLFSNHNQNLFTFFFEFVGRQPLLVSKSLLTSRKQVSASYYKWRFCEKKKKQKMDSEIVMTTRGHDRHSSTRFNQLESKCLASIILQRFSIIESKETSAIMCMRKEAAWEEITEAFNSLTEGNHTVQTLKRQYDVIKRSIRITSIRTGKSYSSQEKGLLKFSNLPELITIAPRVREGDENVCSSADVTTEPSRDSEEEEIESICTSEDMNIEQSRDPEEVQARLAGNDRDEAMSEMLQGASGSEDMTIEPSRDLIEVQTRLAERELEKVALEKHYIQKRGELELTKISLEINFLKQQEARKKELHELQMKYLIEKYQIRQ